MCRFLLIICLFIFNFLTNVPSATADTLSARIATYPDWNRQINLPSPQEELIYPNWFAGKWQVESKLLEQTAPLAPDFMTPGFNNNKQYLNKDIYFQVRFIPTFPTLDVNNFIPNLVNKNQAQVIIADREFNSLAITKAYLENEEETDNNLDIKVFLNPNNSTEQITELSANNKLISTVIGRKTETISPTEFITSELTRQFFRRTFSVYVNLVETDTEYKLTDPDHIKADQFTAIYLSPQDPDYFLAKDKPVALYHYILNLTKISK